MTSSYLKKIILKVLDFLKRYLALFVAEGMFFFLVKFAWSLIVVIRENDIKEKGRLERLELV